MPSAAERAPFWGLVAVVLVLDRITKILAEAGLAGDRVIEVVGDLVRLRLVYNPGAAFGIHVGAYSRWFFLVVALIAVWILHRMWNEAAAADRLRRWSVAVVAGGAAGNAIDRIISSRGAAAFIDVGLNPSLRAPTSTSRHRGSCGGRARPVAVPRTRSVRRIPARDARGCADFSVCARRTNDSTASCAQLQLSVPTPLSWSRRRPSRCAARWPARRTMGARRRIEVTWPEHVRRSISAERHDLDIVFADEHLAITTARGVVIRRRTGTPTG